MGAECQFLHGEGAATEGSEFSTRIKQINKSRPSEVSKQQELITSKQQNFAPSSIKNCHQKRMPLSSCSIWIDKSKSTSYSASSLTTLLSNHNKQIATSMSPVQKLSRTTTSTTTKGRTFKRTRRDGNYNLLLTLIGSLILLISMLQFKASASYEHEHHHHKKHYEAPIVKVIHKTVHIPKAIPVPKYIPVPKIIPVPKTVAVPHPVHISVKVPIYKTVKKVIPVPKKVNVHKPVPVPKPYPVAVPVPVIKHHPYAVYKHVPVHKPYPVPVPYKVHKHVPVGIPKVVHVPKPYPVHYKVPIYKEVIVKKPVEVPVPVYIKKKPVYHPPVYKHVHKKHHHGHYAAATNDQYMAVQPGSTGSGLMSGQQPVGQQQQQSYQQYQQQQQQHQYQQQHQPQQQQHQQHQYTQQVGNSAGESSNEKHNQQQQMMTAASNLDSTSSASGPDLVPQSSSISTRSVLRNSADANEEQFVLTSQQQPVEQQTNSARLQLSQSNGVHQAKDELGGKQPVGTYAIQKSPSLEQQLVAAVHNQQAGMNFQDHVNGGGGNLMSPLDGLTNQFQQSASSEGHQKMAGQAATSLFAPRHMMLAQADTIHPYNTMESQLAAGEQSLSMQQYSQLSNYAQQQQQQQQHQQQPQGKTLLNQLSRLWSIVGARNKSLLPSTSPIGHT